jgi:hypothetical protein
MTQGARQLMPKSGKPDFGWGRRSAGVVLTSHGMTAPHARTSGPGALRYCPVIAAADQ